MGEITVDGSEIIMAGAKIGLNFKVVVSRYVPGPPEPGAARPPPEKGPSGQERVKLVFGG